MKAEVDGADGRRGNDVELHWTKCQVLGQPREARTEQCLSKACESWLLSSGTGSTSVLRDIRSIEEGKKR